MPVWGAGSIKIERSTDPNLLHSIIPLDSSSGFKSYHPKFSTTYKYGTNINHACGTSRGEEVPAFHTRLRRLNGEPEVRLRMTRDICQ
jgi:hypothetical protein